MRRISLAAAGLVALLLLVNAVAGGGADAMVAAARARCAAEGWPAEGLLVGNDKCMNGPFGFGGHGAVEFRVRDADPPRVLRVELRKRVNLLGWEPVGVREQPSAVHE